MTEIQSFQAGSNAIHFITTSGHLTSEVKRLEIMAKAVLALWNIIATIVNDD